MDPWSLTRVKAAEVTKMDGTEGQSERQSGTSAWMAGKIHAGLPVERQGDGIASGMKEAM